MADTIELPGVGSTKKQTMIVAGAVGAGILGYAWYQKRRNAAGVTATENVNDAVGATQYTGAANVAGTTGDATINGGTLPASQIATNAQWTQAAIAFLSQTGNFDPGALATALGKYINRDPAGLTDNEVSMVQAARGAFGDPPTGGPYAIIHASPTDDGARDFPAEGPGLGPPPGAAPHTYVTKPGDTALNIVPRLYPFDPAVNPPTDANLPRRTGVAQAIIATNQHIMPPGIDTPIPAGVFITYY